MDIMHPQLAAYITALVRGTVAETEFLDLVAHAENCEICHAELNRLLDLTHRSRDQFEMAPLETSIHSRQVPVGNTAPNIAVKSCHQTKQGRVVIIFSEMTQEVTTGSAMRDSKLLCHFKSKPETVRDFHVMVDLYHDQIQSKVGRVCIEVDVPGREPLDQAGSQVILRAGAFMQQHSTDELGIAIFTSIPLDIMRHMELEIIPDRGA